MMRWCKHFAALALVSVLPAVTCLKSFGRRQGQKSRLEDGSTLPLQGEVKSGAESTAASEDMANWTDRYQDETFWMGRKLDWTTAHVKPISWRQFITKAKKHNADAKPKIHIFSQLDHADINFVARQSCITAKLMGDNTFFYVAGQNKSEWFHDGTHCDDCYWTPDLHKMERGEKGQRQESNPTAWPKLRFWQHSMNNMDHLGIIESDLCVMMDGLDVYPVSDTNMLHEIYKDVFGEKEGILFSGDTRCHPFCTDPGCWSWGGDYKYKMAGGKIVNGKDVCPRLAEFADGPANYLCAGLFMGRCRLVKKLLNYLDVAIKEDGSRAGYFDQSLYQIMQLRYPELNIKVDSYRQFFQNWHALEFEKIYGIKEDTICDDNWTWDSFKRMKENGAKHHPVFVHYNGDSKVPVMHRCLNAWHEGAKPVLVYQGKGKEGKFWVAPDQHVVVNCGPDEQDGADYTPRMEKILKDQIAAYEPAWYAKHPYDYRRGPCRQIHHKAVCPEDRTKKPA